MEEILDVAHWIFLDSSYTIVKNEQRIQPDYYLALH